MRLVLCGMVLPILGLCACVGPRPGESERDLLVSSSAAELGGEALMVGPRDSLHVAAAKQLLEVAWHNDHSERNLLRYARAAAWIAERQKPDGRDTGELESLWEECAALGEGQQRADALLFAAILYGLFIDTNRLTALGKVPRMLELALASAKLDGAFLQAWAHRVLGEVYLVAPMGISVGDLDKAEYHYNQAVELAPDFPGNWVGLGNLLYAFEEDEDAEAAYNRALEVDPGLEWATEAEEGRVEARQMLTEHFDYSFEAGD